MFLRVGIISGTTTTLGTSEFNWSLPSGTAVNADPNCAGVMIVNGGGASTHIQEAVRVVKNTSVVSARSTVPATTTSPISLNGSGYTIDAQIIVELA
jgi:hypothetical protein